MFHPNTHAERACTPTDSAATVGAGVVGEVRQSAGPLRLGDRRSAILYTHMMRGEERAGHLWFAGHLRPPPARRGRDASGTRRC
jgi:hypothetical protein